MKLKRVQEDIGSLEALMREKAYSKDIYSKQFQKAYVEAMRDCGNFIKLLNEEKELKTNGDRQEV